MFFHGHTVFSRPYGCPCHDHIKYDHMFLQEGELLESLDRLISEERCEVLYVGLGCDVFELCSPPRASKEAESAGLGSGPVYDIKSVWDLTSKGVQDRVLAEITQQRPELVARSPSCKT